MEAGPLKHSSPVVSQSAQQQIIQEIQKQERFIRAENKGVNLSTGGCIIFEIPHFYLYFTIPPPSPDLNQAVG